MSTVPIGERVGELEEPHGVSVPAPHHEVPYYWIFVILVALTLVTVAVATRRFHSEYVNVLVALLIASVKGTFVARYFMHLKFEGKLIYLILFGPVTLCILLIAALLPDILYARGEAPNDVVTWFQNLFP